MNKRNYHKTITYLLIIFMLLPALNVFSQTNIGEATLVRIYTKTKNNMVYSTDYIIMKDTIYNTLFMSFYESTCNGDTNNKKLLDLIDYQSRYKIQDIFNSQKAKYFRNYNGQIITKKYFEICIKVQVEYYVSKCDFRPHDFLKLKNNNKILIVKLLSKKYKRVPPSNILIDEIIKSSTIKPPSPPSSPSTNQ